MSKLRKATLPNPHLLKALLDSLFGTLRFLPNQNTHRYLEGGFTEADMLAWNQTPLFRRLRLLIEGRILSLQKSGRSYQIFGRSTKP